MNNLFTFFSHWALCSRTPLHINDFKEIRHTSSVFPNGFFVKNKPGGVLLEYYNNQNVRIGYIRYYITTGQIGLFFIEDDYQHRGLGTQILSKVIEVLTKNHCDEVWAVTSEHHPFWSNVYNKSFVYRHPAHPTVIGDGYFMKLNSYSS
jgi:GNAT superfamily N-acetyltransferase